MMNRWEEEALIERIRAIKAEQAKEATIFDQAKSWPFQEARSLLAHIEKKGKKPGDVVTFETGYGPSGAPHIGTFGEVVRTLWVMRAFNELTQNAYKTRLIMFSDDYDAMRKVPDDMPEWMNEYLGLPLSEVPSPYSNDPGVTQVMVDPMTFAEANNDKLCEFVDRILKDYNGGQVGASPDRSTVSFVSSSRYYKSGKFNEMLNRVWDNFDKIQEIMLATLGDDRKATYSPFMPRWCGKGPVLQVKAEATGARGYIGWVTDDGEHCGQMSHNGNAKLQWKVDWAMRWVYFDVDYEMSGKDLIDSVKASNQICRILGGTPPLNLTYELFLDENGAKISKSKGNGFTVEQWLTYGSTGSLMLFMFQNPRAAKKLYREIVPQLEDQYVKLRQKAETTPDDATWHFRVELPEPLSSDISHGLMLNLAVVAQAKQPENLLAYLMQGREFADATAAYAREMAPKVIAYATDKGLFERSRREPTEKERAAFSELATRFSLMLENMTAEHYQYQVYEVGKKHEFEPLRSWFQALYECLLGSSDGPRFGAFTVAYGLRNTIALLRQYEQVDA
jgi:lysyl-tRNA synthetase class 1